MRIWSLHPCYLDAKGIVALWRETLLAQAALYGETRGYTNHPQLYRFREHNNPRGAIGAYLLAVHAEAEARGYHFDIGRIRSTDPVESIHVTRGQIIYEQQHLLAKLAIRDPGRRAMLETIRSPLAHPFFHIVAGEIAHWERLADAGQ